MKKILTSIFLLVLPILVHSQGEDSTKFERDEMIISEFLPGLYSNYNQVYFNNRGKVPDEERHRRREIEIKKLKPISLVSLILLLMPIFLKKP